MTVEIGNIIKDLLEPLRIGSTGSNQFIDKLSGVVKKISISDKGENDSRLSKSFPVSCNISFDDCAKKGAYRDLIPNSKLGCIVYLEEDGGAEKISDIRDGKQFKASYLIVGWINQKKLGTDECSVTGSIINTIINEISVKPFNSGIYQTIKVDVLGINPKSVNPMDKYTYDEDSTQYLFTPYDYFSIKIDVTVNINSKCVIPFEKQTPLICNP